MMKLLLMLYYTLTAILAILLLIPEPANAGKFSRQTCSSHTSYGGTTRTSCRNPGITCRSTTSYGGTTRTTCR